MSAPSSLQAPPPLYVVNLDRAPERWAKVQAGLAREGLVPERFAAIDAAKGEHLPVSRYDESRSLARRGLPLRPAELGCFASHYLLWQRIQESGRPAVVMEDDVRIDEDFAHAVALAQSLAEHCPMIRLSALQRGREPRLVAELGEGYRLVRHNKGPGGTQAYFLTPAGAARFLEDARVWFEPVDDHMDAYWRHGVAALAIMPYRVSHDDEGHSYIQPAKPPKRSPLNWLRRKLNRRLDRLRAYLWLATHPARLP